VLELLPEEACPGCKTRMYMFCCFESKPVGRRGSLSSTEASYNHSPYPAAVPAVSVAGGIFWTAVPAPPSQKNLEGRLTLLHSCRETEGAGWEELRWQLLSLRAGLSHT
jgi:hypothetical protein